LIEAIKQAGNVIQPVLGLGDAYRGSGEMVYEELLLPNESLLEAVASVGHTNIILNEDGVGRQAPLIIRAGEEQYPSMAIAAIRVFMGVEESQFGELDNGVLEFAGRRIPVDNSSAMIVNYAGPPASPDFTTFQTVSYRSVIDGQAPGELIKDKIVLVGMTATGERDYYMTPVSHGRPMAGVEVMANKIETIWSGRFIDRPGEGLRILILMLIGVLVGMLPQRIWTGLALTILITVLYILVASWLFDSRGVMLDLFYPFLVMTLSYAVTTAYRLAAR
jgi:CHASE2 domain-containing sensor protein